MTDTATIPVPTTEWNTAFQTLKARYPKVREPIVVALHILTQNPDIALDDAKAQAALHGVRITAASVSAAQRLLSRQDGASAPETPTANPATPRARRATRANAPTDIEGVVRDAVTRISAQGAADAERLRAAMRKAVAALEAGLES